MSLVERLEDAALQADRDSHEFPPIRTNWSPLLQEAADFIREYVSAQREAADFISFYAGKDVRALSTRMALRFAGALCMNLAGSARASPEWTADQMAAARKIMVACGLSPQSPSREPGADELADSIAKIIAQSSKP